MLKYLLALVISLSAFTAAAAEAGDPRSAAAKTLAGDGGIAKTAVARAATSPAREAAATPQQLDEVSWKMVLAAVALMAAVALRRFGSEPR